METNSCPVCGKPFSVSARYCTGCGADVVLSEATISLKKKRTAQGKLATETTQAHSSAQLDESNETTQIVKVFRKEARAGLVQEIYEVIEDDLDDDLIERHENWQKVVEHKTPPQLPAVVLSSEDIGTFHSLLPRFPRQRVPPRLFFWLSLVTLLALLLGGTFGVAISFGREEQPPVASNVRATLETSPATIALGGIIALRGVQFTPHSQIIFTHDQQLPLVDTGGASTIKADAHGTFSDTFIIGPVWSAGAHILYATDSLTHQRIATSITVVGQSVLQGPPHLLLSSTTLNLGTGDETTNSSKLLALSNAGGGLIGWQASNSEPWLQISPKSGSIASGETMTAMVAVGRANLAPGSYTATIVFTSNTEQTELAVTMQVIPLQPAHQAILQLSEATLNFNGTAGGSAPLAQTISISNPGIQPLNWQASPNLENGFDWLVVSQTSGEIEPGGEQELNISVNTLDLSPGVYKGAILFEKVGTQAIQDSPQSIYVSLTITPMCTLNFTPGSLSFTGTAGQTTLSAQSLHISVVQGCITSQSWTATTHTTTGGNWLKIDQTSGQAPAQIQVSADPTNLAQGKYSGTITFTSSTGPQIVAVTLTLDPIPCALTGTNAVTLQGTAGQTTAASGTATLSTTGNCTHTLNWTATSSVTTPGGGTWLRATNTGTLTQPATASVGIQANLTGLTANTYTGTVTVTVVDSTTGHLVGMVQIAITLTVLAPSPPCTLQASSPSALTFSASMGSNPAVPSQSITLGVTGTCAGNVTVTPSTDAGSSAWLSADLTPEVIISGSQATFTITVASGALSAGIYTGTVILNAADGNGAITGSPQAVSVTLTVQ